MSTTTVSLTEHWCVWSTADPATRVPLGLVTIVKRAYAIQYRAHDMTGRELIGNDDDPETGWDEDPGGSGYLTPEHAAVALLSDPAMPAPDLVSGWVVRRRADDVTLGTVSTERRSTVVHYLAKDTDGREVTGGDSWDDDPGGSGYWTPEDAAQALARDHSPAAAN